MHGRLKVKDSAEKAAEKAREREKKRKKYLAGLNVLFDKRASGACDAESLHVSALLLQANPDALTLWNTRRVVLLGLCKEYKCKQEAAADVKPDCDETLTSSKVADAATPSPSDLNSSETSTIPSSEVTTGSRAEAAQQSSQDNKANTQVESSVQKDEACVPALPPLPDTWKQLLEAELHVVSACLQHNPKSYGAWHHRTWVMEQLCQGASAEDRKKAWDSELNLCNLFLTKDERNFHCWDYRRHVVREGGVAAERELRYSLRLIERNLSNFSAWHYRAKLLPVLHPPKAGCPHPVEEAVFREELQRVEQAVFTDPGDQSPWFFLRWLLQRQPPTPRPVWLGVCRSSPSHLLLVCTFTAAVDRSSLPHLTLPAPFAAVEWAPAAGGVAVRATVWTACVEAPSLPSHDVTLLVSAQFPDGGPSAALSLSSASPDGSSAVAWLCGQDKPQLGAQLSHESREALEDLSTQCTLLDDIDPNNKWVLLTLVETQWTLGAENLRKQVQEHLDKLRDLDPLRERHYTDTKSKLALEEVTSSYVSAAVAGLQSDSSSPYSQELPAFVACDLSLSCLCGVQWLACCPSIDLSGNRLHSLNTLPLLPLCRELLLDDNPLGDLRPVAQLPNVRRVSLNNCGLQNPDQLQPLTQLTTLRHLSAKGNFSQEHDISRVQEMFQHLCSVDL